MRGGGRWALALLTAAATMEFMGSSGGVTGSLRPTGAGEPVRAVLAGAGPNATADGYIAAQRLSPRCRGSVHRMVRNGPDKYALGRCVTAGRRAPLLPEPTRRLLPEAAFASLIAEEGCVNASCKAAAELAGGRWVLVGGRPGVRPRTTGACPRYRNLNFATDTPVPEDRLARPIPPGTQVLWRYASRGGHWVMAHWPAGGAYAWAFIPRDCVPDPPRWSEIALWNDTDRRAGIRRPTRGERVRILRPALRCPSRLRCPPAAR